MTYRVATGRSYGLALGLIVAAAGLPAQTTVNLVGTGFSAPGNGVILSGTAINPNTGLPYRHHWAGTAANGVCRLDPDVDTGGVTGPYSMNTTTCITTVAGTPFKPGPIVFDPLTNNIYAVDGGSKSQGIVRLHFVASDSGGHGGMDRNRIEIVGNGCGLSGNLPVAAALGPDGNLYVGFKKNGNIVRLVSPQTEPLPCGNIVTIGTTADTRRDAGLAFIAHDLYGADGLGPWVMAVADQCAVGGNGACRAASLFAGQVNLPTAVLSDQTYPQTNGTTAYFASTNTVATIQVSPLALNNLYASGFQFGSGLTWDANQQILWVGDDPSNGVTAGTGRWSEVFTNLAAITAPGAPVAVTAVPGDSSATVSWVRAADGQPISSFTLRTLMGDGSPSGIPDQTNIVNTSSMIVGGLVNGTAYEFEVQAVNTVGASPFSAPSNVVTPQAPTPPAPPTGVTAIAGSGSAAVSWVPPANNGSPVTGYTVTAYSLGFPAGITTSTLGNATSAIILGLTNGTEYTFTVFATNAVGNSGESAPSNAVTPTLASVDAAVTMTGPSAVNAGASATYVMSVINNGPDSAAGMTLTDNFAGAVLTSPPVTTAGSCQVVSTTMTCNLGPMSINTVATVTLTVTPKSPIVNSASIQALDPAQAVIPDPNTLNNTANVSTALATPLVTTDLQVTGSAKFGSPAVGSAEVYTWQVKNSTNKAAASTVFTDPLPPQMTFQSVSATGAVCTGPAPGTAGGTVTCTADAFTGQMVITINTTANAPGSIPNTGSVTFNGTDTNLSNNSFTVVVTAK